MNAVRPWFSQVVSGATTYTPIPTRAATKLMEQVGDNFFRLFLDEVAHPSTARRAILRRTFGPQQGAQRAADRWPLPHRVKQHSAASAVAFAWSQW